MSSIVDIIKHYQKSIDKSLNDEERLTHCIGKLYRLPVSVQHLQETGIGRTVNGLRKYDGEVGVAAKALVSKWKNMVAAEESDTGEPEPQHQNHEEEDEDNYDDSRLQVDEDRQSDDHQDEEVEEEEDQVDEDHHQQEEESDNQEELQPPQQQVTNGHDSDHRSERSSHRNSDRHRSSSKHKSDRHSHHSSSSSKDGSRSRDRHEKHRDEEKNQHHSSSTKGHSSSSSSSSPSSSKKSSGRADEGKEKKDKHSSMKDSSHSNGKKGSHSGSKEKTSSSDKHHSKSKESLNGFTKEDESHKRKRTTEEEEESAVKKVKNDQPSESKSKSSSSHSSSGKDRSGSKSSSSSGSSKEKDKKPSSEKKKESSTKRKSEQPPDDFDDEGDDSGGASFADALAMIGMPSTSKKKTSSKGSSDKVKLSSSSSMPPPPVRSDKHRSSSSRSGSSNRSVSPSSTASSSGYGSCSTTPSLLAQKPKLEPLAIAEIVGMISPNYKPMPLNQTVMECVFSNNGKPQKRPLTAEEALGQSMQSKNLRTKVYSGVKTFKGEVPTLYSMCIRLLQEHIDLIDYTGNIPFDLLKPVLERATPDQLFTLEDYNNYLMEDSDVLWEQHCRRKFRSQKRKEEECESWREMFIRCSEEQETKLLSLTANIKQSQEAKAAPVRKTQLAYVDSAVKPPRNVISKQARYGTAQAPVVSPAARVASLNNATSNVAKVGDSRLKVAAGVRDTAQAQVFHQSKPKKAPLMTKVMASIKGFKGFRR